MNREEMSSKIQSIREGTELFYQQRISEAMQSYEKMLEEMLAIVDDLFAIHKEHPEIPIEEEKLQSIFAEILSAMEQKDYILMADIITYDFIETIEKIQELL